MKDKENTSAQNNTGAAQSKHHGADEQKHGKHHDAVDLESLEQEVNPEPRKSSAAVEELKKQLAQEKDKYIRLAAEYDNFRKRSARERESLFNDAYSDAVAAFLPLYDNLERALANPCADESYKKGVELIMKQFNDIFAKLQIEQTPGVGQPFDPNYHNAVIHIESDEFPENTVAEVLQKGFIMKDRVLRYAMVKAAN